MIKFDGCIQFSSNRCIDIPSVDHSASPYYIPDIQSMSGAGLEKLTNANRSVSAVYGWLFPVELTEIADWTSVSEYTFEFRTNLDKGHRQGILVHIQSTLVISTSIISNNRLS